MTVHLIERILYLFALGFCASITLEWALNTRKGDMAPIMAGILTGLCVAISGLWLGTLDACQ